MMKKILSVCLAIFMFTAVSGVNAFARANDDNKQVVANTAKKIETKEIKSVFKTENGSESSLGKTDYSRAEYERQKAQGNKFSTKTKVLIGVGIAAAVVGIVVFAASRDKIRTF